MSLHDISTYESFFIGGRYVETSDGHHIMIDQLYVQRYGASKSGRRPIVLIHGAAQTGIHWEYTPDGRPGLALCLASQGRIVYVVDQPGIGRSRYYYHSGGLLTHYSAESLEMLFTRPANHKLWPQAELHTQFPGTGKVGDPIFDEFYASQVGHFSSYSQREPLIRAAGAALMKRVGPAYLLTHSQSGPLGWQIADACPDLVVGVIALEPHGPPFKYPDCPPFNLKKQTPNALDRPYGITSTPLTYDPPLRPDEKNLSYEAIDEPPRPDCIGGFHQGQPQRKLPNLAKISIIVLTAESSYHTMYDYLTVQFLREAGVDVKHIYLADEGIKGNGHMMAIEKNNLEIGTFISGLLDSQDKIASRAMSNDRELCCHSVK